jgi:hypothetical protein
MARTTGSLLQSASPRNAGGGQEAEVQGRGTERATQSVGGDALGRTCLQSEAAVEDGLWDRVLVVCRERYQTTHTSILRLDTCPVCVPAEHTLQGVWTRRRAGRSRQPAVTSNGHAHGPGLHAPNRCGSGPGGVQASAAATWCGGSRRGCGGALAGSVTRGRGWRHP